MDQSDWKRLMRKFPDAYPLYSDLADSMITDELRNRGMNNTLRVREKGGTYRKLIDPLLISSANTLMVLDSDILFFESPTELLSIAGSEKHSNTFNRDPIQYPYTIDGETAKRSFGIDIAEHINTGLALIHRKSMSLDRIEEYSSDAAVTSTQHFIEQTILALLAAEFGYSLLPDTYCCSQRVGLFTDDGTPVVAKHYIESPRPLMFEEGIVTLMDRAPTQNVQA